MASSSEIRVRYLLHIVTYFPSCSRSVRPTLRGLVINVDVSHAIVYDRSLIVPFSCTYLIFFTLISYEEMPVLDWACTFLSKFASRRGRVQPQDLERLAESDMKLLKTVLKGVRVTVSVPANRRLARPIKDLVLNVGNYQFMKGDEETTIKVRSVTLLSGFFFHYIFSGLLRREIWLQASIPEGIWYMR
jgi:hypothetical protein